MGEGVSSVLLSGPEKEAREREKRVDADMATSCGYTCAHAVHHLLTETSISGRAIIFGVN